MLIDSFFKILEVIDEYKIKFRQPPEYITFKIGALEVAFQSPVPVGTWDMIKGVVEELRRLAVASLVDFGYFVFEYKSVPWMQMMVSVFVGIWPYMGQVPNEVNHIIINGLSG
ncbi:hypothetical protein ACLMJK_002745 [Lecanora helva]